MNSTNELCGGTAEQALVAPEDNSSASGGSPVFITKENKMADMADMVEQIADTLLDDHMALMTENAALRHKADGYNDAMYFLAKLRDKAFFPSGEYGQEILAELDTMLNAHFGEVRPDFGVVK